MSRCATCRTRPGTCGSASRRGRAHLVAEKRRRDELSLAERQAVETDAHPVPAASPEGPKAVETGLGRSRRRCRASRPGDEPPGHVPRVALNVSSAADDSFGRNSSVSRPSAPTSASRDAAATPPGRGHAPRRPCRPEALVLEDDALGVALGGHASFPEPDRAVAQGRDEVHRVAGEEDRPARRLQLEDAVHALFWKRPSPTASASSRRITSGRTAVATENARRICMPRSTSSRGGRRSPELGECLDLGQRGRRLLRESPRARPGG